MITSSSCFPSCGPVAFPFLLEGSAEQVTSESYLAESYLVLALGSEGGKSPRMGLFPFRAPHSLQEMSLSLGEPLSSVGKLQEGSKSSFTFSILVSSGARTLLCKLIAPL